MLLFFYIIDFDIGHLIHFYLCNLLFFVYNIIRN
jgi:hypothetical protein